MVAVPSIGRASEVTPRRAAPEADATRDLYERYARQIYTYCLHQLGNREEAEDAVQSTFLNAFRGFKRGVDPEFESAWIYKIAQNVCLTRQRSSSRRRRVETASDLDAMQDYVPAHEIDADELINLPEALDAMPHQQRKALLLREWQGLSYKEIADELDLTQAAVETLLFRARRSLAAGLGEEPAKKSALQRLRTGGDAGSALALLKSFLFTGGVKVATAVATVAATSVVAATPAARHAVEDVVTPGHDRTPAPAHQVARTPEPGGAPASSRANLPQALVPAAATVSSLVAPAHAHRATAARDATLLRPHDSRAQTPPSTPAVTAHPAVPAPTSVDTAAPPPAPVAAAPVAPTETPQAPAASDPAPAAPAATQPAAPEKAKGDDNKKADDNKQADAPQSAPAAPAAKKDDPPGQKKNDAAATTSSQPSTSGSAPSSGDGGNRRTSDATPAAAPSSAPPADPAPPKSDPKPSNGNGNGNGNGKGNDDKGNGNGKKADAAPVLPAAPAPAPATTTVATTSTLTTTVAAPPPPAAVQPTAATAQPVSTDNGNGKDKNKGENGNGNGNGNGKKK